MITVLNNQNLLLFLIVGQAIQLIWWLIKSIWDSKAKKLEHIEKYVALIPQLLEKQERTEEYLKIHVPNHDAVELKIYRALKDKNQ